MKLSCSCGNVISDNTDALPWKACIRTDEDMDQALIDAAQTIVRLLEARERGELREFLTTLFLAGDGRLAMWSSMLS